MDGDLLRRGLKLSHLRLMAALSGAGALGDAAARLGIAQPAASRLLAEAEVIAGRPLRRREGRGIVLTPEGAALAARASRILTEIDAAGRDLDEMGAGLSGAVRIGAVTGAALDRVLPALRTARVALPGVSVAVEVATSDILAPMVAAGQIDFALCRLPAGRAEGLSFDLVGPEPVAIVARRDHPLAGGGPVVARALMDYDWILPGPGAILRQAVLDRLAALGLPATQGRLVTASFLLTLAWLDQSNAVAPLAAAVAARFARGPGAAYCVLPVDLGIVVAPYGIVERRDAIPTPAAARIRALLAGPAAAGAGDAVR